MRLSFREKATRSAYWNAIERGDADLCMESARGGAASHSTDTCQSMGGDHCWALRSPRSSRDRLTLSGHEHSIDTRVNRCRIEKPDPSDTNPRKATGRGIPVVKEKKIQTPKDLVAAVINSFPASRDECEKADGRARC